MSSTPTPTTRVAATVSTNNNNIDDQHQNDGSWSKIVPAERYKGLSEVPEGWFVQGRKRSNSSSTTDWYFYEPGTHKMFRSLAAVKRHLEGEKEQLDILEPKRKEPKTTAEGNEATIGAPIDDHHENKTIIKGNESTTGANIDDHLEGTTSAKGNEVAVEETIHDFDLNA